MIISNTVYFIFRLSNIRYHEVDLIVTAENIGFVVRDTRKALGLTQVEIAQRSGCSQRFVSELERGKGTGEFCRVLAVLSSLGISLQAIPNQRFDVEYELSVVESGLIEPEEKRSRKLVDFL